MLRVLIPYTLFCIRLWYRICHDVAHWCLRIAPMPPLVRHQLAGAVALVPYLFNVWLFVVAFDFTWRAHVIAGVITLWMLLVVRRAEVRHAALSG